MWAIDNIEDVVIYLWLFIMTPIMCYALYSLSEISIIFWLLISVVSACVISLFFSPFIMIIIAILEGTIKLFSRRTEI
ncbi:hypothetical protein [Ursidibacter arcticus]|nr:hypothetical protein A1D25_04125 [Ursidibacter arcticus]